MRVLHKITRLVLPSPVHTETVKAWCNQPFTESIASTVLLEGDGWRNRSLPANRVNGYRRLEEGNLFVPLSRRVIPRNISNCDRAVICDNYLVKRPFRFVQSYIRS